MHWLSYTSLTSSVYTAHRNYFKVRFCAFWAFFLLFKDEENIDQYNRNFFTSCVKWSQNWPKYRFCARYTVVMRYMVWNPIRILKVHFLTFQKETNFSFWKFGNILWLANIWADLWPSWYILIFALMWCLLSVVNFRGFELG